jgi:glycosyltransferase involved in cell wall biosynthesis
MFENLRVIIPAYKPDNILFSLVEELSERKFHIIVVNDGSGVVYQKLFQSIATLPHTTLLEHACNRGKGEALKTAFNFIVCQQQDAIKGVITADADGQHTPEDIEKVACQFTDRPDSLILGCRKMNHQVPFRSRFGNQLTRKVFSVLSGQRVSDTQTGLRGIPATLIPDLLALKSSAYDFELDMLLLAARKKMPIVEIPIRTIYLDDNAGSHFNPIIDSLKIYFVFLRFIGAGLLCGVLDYLGFLFIYSITGNILFSESVARFIFVLLNFSLNKTLVFKSEAGLFRTLVEYLALVLVNLFLSYSMIQALNSMGVSVAVSKLVALFILSIFNFAVQRTFIFRNN